MKSRYFHSYVSLAVLAFLLLFPASFSFAQAIKRNTGNLTAARQATVNGERAISGLTLYEKSRIKTASLGTAIMNLGTKGRIELADETDFTLWLAADSVGGDLQEGRAVLNIPVNVLARVKVANCQIQTDGKEATNLSIEISNERLTVKVYYGKVKIADTEKVELIASGKELKLNLRTQERNYRDVAKSDHIIEMSPIKSSSPILRLLDTSIIESLRYLASSFLATPVYYATTLTCRDSDNLHCHANGSVIP